jgi:hypothetical protein
MAMTSFQSTSLAVAGGSCGLSMWDLVEEKRFCYHEPQKSMSRATAICQVKYADVHFDVLCICPNTHSLHQTDGANAGLASCVVTGTADGAILVYDVRVGRGSSGLKPVTTFQNAHSEEVHCIFLVPVVHRSFDICLPPDFVIRQPQ